MSQREKYRFRVIYHQLMAIHELVLYRIRTVPIVKYVCYQDFFMACDSFNFLGMEEHC